MLVRISTATTPTIKSTKITIGFTSSKARNNARKVRIAATEVPITAKKSFMPLVEFLKLRANKKANTAPAKIKANRLKADPPGRLLPP